VHEYSTYLHCRLGNWREAEAHFRKATALDPRNVRFLDAAVSQLFEPLQRWAEAQAALDRALEISPDNPGLITTKADVYQEEGRLDEAAKQLARLPSDSNDNYLLNVRATQAAWERDFDQAIYWTERAVGAIKPDQPLSAVNAFALVMQGHCHRWAGRPDAARATFERLIEGLRRTPGFTAAPARGLRSVVSAAYAGLGERELALEQAHQAVADAENNAILKPQAEAALARVQARFGDADGAIALLSHLVEVPRGLPPANLRYSPHWDPLRGDPRFEALLNRAPSLRY
jgi:tetratricopeptide (TPR) repeat protein